jgi:hypothetical protein
LHFGCGSRFSFLLIQIRANLFWIESLSFGSIELTALVVDFVSVELFGAHIRGRFLPAAGGSPFLIACFRLAPVWFTFPTQCCLRPFVWLVSVFAPAERCHLDFRSVGFMTFAHFTIFFAQSSMVPATPVSHRNHSQFIFLLALSNFSFAKILLLGESPGLYLRAQGAPAQLAWS